MEGRGGAMQEDGGKLAGSMVNKQLWVQMSITFKGGILILCLTEPENAEEFTQDLRSKLEV